MDLSLGKIFASVILAANALLWAHSSAIAGGCGDPIDRSVNIGEPGGFLLVANGGMTPVQNGPVQGRWTADADPDNGAGIHCHTLEILSQVGPGQYNAVVDTTYRNGRSLQTCDVLVSGVNVLVTCSVIFADTDYAPDNFSLTLNGNSLTGTNRDDRGTLSQTLFCKI